MHVYFVRHGRTDLNMRHIHQSPNTPLSDHGRDDARTVAEYVRQMNPTLLLTSEYTRARETAGIIGLTLGLTPHIPGVFYEIERPSAFFHRSIFSIETFWYVFLSVLKWKNPTYRYKDAENYSDIEKRAVRAEAYLIEQSALHESIVVVSHTVFLHILLTVLLRKHVSLFEFVMLFFQSGHMKNGEVIHVLYDKSDKAHPWKLVDEEGSR